MKQLTIIAALDERGGIGKGGTLPWRLPADLKHFKSTTEDSVVIMGRKTYESIGRPLEARYNIVLTRNWREYFTDEPIDAVSSLDAALTLAGTTRPIFIIGGGEIYKEALPLCDHMILTHVRGDFGCDTFFPKFNPGEWNSWEKEEQTDEKSGVKFAFATYVRKVGGSGR